MRVGVKARILDETLAALGLPMKDAAKLPQVAQRLAMLARVSPIIVAFTFQPLTGQVLNIASTLTQQTSQAFLQAAQAASTVSQMLMKKALEVGNVPTDSERKGVDGVQEPCENSEPRDGVGEEDSLVAPVNDSGESAAGGSSGDSRIT